MIINEMAIKIIKWASIVLLFLLMLIPLIATILFRLTNYLSRPSNPKEAKIRGENLARSSGKTVIAVVAHPDDVDWYCGGTLSALSHSGNKVIVVAGTSGEKGGNGLPELAKVREEEQRNAGKVLGYGEIIFLRHPDKGLKANANFKSQISNLIEKYRPEILLTFDTEKEGYVYRHPDHEAAGIASLEAAKDTEIVRSVYFFHSSAPNIIFDISHYMDLKASALLMHKSQMVSRNNNKFLRLIGRLFLGNRQNPVAGFNQSFPQIGVKAAEVFRHIEL